MAGGKHLASAAAAHFPYAHPTYAEIAHINALPTSSPAAARLLTEARERAASIVSHHLTAPNGSGASAAVTKPLAADGNLGVPSDSAWQA